MVYLWGLKGDASLGWIAVLIYAVCCILRLARFNVGNKAAPKGEPHNIYDVVPDSKNNVYFTDFRQKHIGRIDAKTGEIKLFAILTPSPALRRGQMDAQDRLWFAEFRGNKIAMFDTKTELRRSKVILPSGFG